MRLFGLDGPKILADFSHFTPSAGGADKSLSRTPYDQRPGVADVGATLALNLELDAATLATLPRGTPLPIGTFAFQFNNFNVIYLLTSGNPALPNTDAGGTDILVSYSYKLTLTQQRFAVASAYTVIIFLIVAVLSAIQMRSSKAFSEVK